MSCYPVNEGMLEPLLRGLAIFGTGGGGSPEFGRAIIENDLKQGRKYTLINPEDVEDEALIVSGGIMGSVKAVDTGSFKNIVARWERNFELLEALRTMEEFLQKKIDYVVPFELGGLNTPVMLSLGARAGIPVVNGDALGRAAPETEMTTFWGHGIQITPMSMIDSSGNIVIVKQTSNTLFPDKIGRWMVTQAMGMGANNHYPMSGEQLKRYVIPQTIQKAIEIGQAMNQTSTRSLGSTLAKHLGGRVLIDAGQIMSIEEEDREGWLHQNVIIERRDRPGDKIRIAVKNEAMVCFYNNKPSCIFPDLIIMLDPGTGKGIMSSELEEGQEVSIAVAPCHPRLREALQSPQGGEAFSPARYGYKDLEYIPVESLETWGSTM